MLDCQMWWETQQSEKLQSLREGGTVRVGRKLSHIETIFEQHAVTN